MTDETRFVTIQCSRTCRPIFSIFF